MVRRFLALVATLAVLAPAPALAAEPLRLRFPVPDPSVEFFNDWGLPRPGGRSHQGTDLMAAKMTPVVSVADGFVLRVATSPRAGAHVMIRHAGGWESWYMHLNNDSPGTDDGAGDEWAFAPGLEVGAFVAAGEVIGWVGDSGNAEGSEPHLHFELHDGRRARNPYPFLAAAWERLQLGWAIEAGETPFK